MAAIKSQNDEIAALTNHNSEIIGEIIVAIKAQNNKFAAIKKQNGEIKQEVGRHIVSQR
ncbi:hypothetical protein O9K51_09515 [Purpureocillium lavendulum]|uniref:Uncharacterized protein n=1 Tax=Purpureocillium lavendulum TaxID=1247861 RepID=A0AB34FGP9_9HYPO|nr:hypothetical protein O9K51_09515 [Purpureocillium lavendulum]